MRRRDFLSLLPATAAPSAPALRTNVVVILADDLGNHDVGYHGSEIRTPHIDRLAQQGVRFERAYSFPVCSPTRSGLMTGRSPMRLGTGYTVIRPWSGYGIPTSERFLPQAFHDAGYQTAITGKWHLGHAYRKFLPNARGFDLAYGHLNGALDYFNHERDGGLDWNRNGKSLRESGYTTNLLGDEACRFVKQRDKARPFFLYLPFNAPHTPLQAPQGFLDQYAHVSDTRRRAYAAMTAAMDHNVGRVLSTLDDEKLAQDTLVLFFSDNGGPTGQGATNTPLRGAKGSCFEGGIRVPAIMRFPGRLKPGSTSNQVLSMMDYFPTLAAAAGVPTGPHQPFDGMNLWPAITSEKPVARGEIHFSVQSGQTDHFAVLTPDWKLVHTEPRNGTPTNLLFRIAEDPNETTDLSAKNPQVVATLIASLDAWKKLHPPNGVRDTGQPAGYKAPPLWAEAAREG